MATQCLYCGSELYAGQRFCRYCGKPSGQYDEEAMPTQAMPPQGADPQRERARTAPQYRPDTNPVYVPPQPSSYQTPPGPPVMRPPLYPSVPTGKGRSPWAWIVGLISFGLIGAMVLTVVLITRTFRDNTSQSSGIPGATTPRANEEDFGRVGMPGREISVDGSETTIKQSFPLTANSRFSLDMASGEARIEGWDQPQAEITVIKRGSSRTNRSRAKIYFTNQAGDLAFRVDQSRARGVELEFLIKLPRSLRQVEINGASAELRLTGINSDVTVKSASGDVELSNIKGKVSASSQSGEIAISRIEGNVTTNTVSGSAELSEIKGRIESSSTSGKTELEEITGSAKVNSVSGQIDAAFIEIPAGEPMEFNSTSGKIDIKLNAPVNLDFEARTLSGSIEIDEALGIAVEERTPGQRARGRLGRGGQPLSVETTSGGITVNIEGKQPAAGEATEATEAPETKQQPGQAKARSN